MTLWTGDVDWQGARLGMILSLQCKYKSVNLVTVIKNYGEV